MAASGGGCQLEGTASFSPGLTTTAAPFNYSFNGALTGCQSTVAGAPTSGSVSAGEVITEAGTGYQYQEPAASGNGSCLNGTTSGMAIATWADGTVTVIDYNTDAVAVAVNLSGTVIPSVTLQAVNPVVGQPPTKTITTTRYDGNAAQGVLAFEADAAQCNSPGGVTSAAIEGFTGLGTSSWPRTDKHASESERRREAPLAYRREISVSGTVDVRPCLSQRTVAVPPFGSTDCTRPISPVAFLRTWPGGSGLEVFVPGAFGFRGSPGRRTVLSFRSSPASGASSFGTTVAPVPLVK